MKVLTLLIGLCSACEAASIMGKVHRNQVRDDAKFSYDPSTTHHCTLWYDNEDGSISCDGMPKSWGITLEEWKRWNPSVAESCDKFVVGKSYCVEADDKSPVPTSSSTASLKTTSTTTRSSTTTTTSTTRPNNGIVTPMPTQPGMVSNCNRFRKVRSEDTCDIIIRENGISLTEFTEWNAGVGDQACTELWLDTFVCVSVIGHETKPSNTKPDNDIATPVPYQPGIVNNCNQFYKVSKGDTCAGIASKNGKTLKDIITWNPQVGGEACSGLWLDAYVCISVLGHRPSPLVQPSIASPCSKLYRAVSGDTCQAIVDKQRGLTLADFYKWNPAVKNDCTGLLAGYNYCISIP